MVCKSAVILVVIGWVDFARLFHQMREMELLPLHLVNNPVLKTMGLYGDPHAVFVHPSVLVEKGLQGNSFAILCSDDACTSESTCIHVEIYTETSVPPDRICAPQWIVNSFSSCESKTVNAYLVSSSGVEMR